MLFVGGIFNGAPSLSSAEVFVPATNSFSSARIGALGTARQAPAAARLPDERVLVSGSYVDGPYLASAEVYDPATNSFSSAGIGALSTARTYTGAAPLPDGRWWSPGFDSPPVSRARRSSRPPTPFSFAVNETKLLVSVQASGKISVSDAATQLRVSTTRRNESFS